MTTDPDQLTKSRSQYDVSWQELMLRNFLAGASRAFGSLVFNLAMIVLLGVLISKYVMPGLNPVLINLQSLTQSLEGLDQKFNLSTDPTQWRLPQF